MPFPALCLGSPGVLDWVPLPPVWTQGSMVRDSVSSERAGSASNPLNIPGYLLSINYELASTFQLRCELDHRSYQNEPKEKDEILTEYHQSVRNFHRCHHI